MFNFPIIDEKLIWLVPIAFYILDNCCLIEEKQIILMEDMRLNWSFRISKMPFLLAKRHLYITPIFLPFTFAFKLPWFSEEKTDLYKLTLYRRYNILWRNRLIEIRMIGCVAWLNLFILGPAITINSGIITSLQYVLPIHIISLLFIGVFLIINKDNLNNDINKSIKIILELLLSPGYVPNICRRLSLDLANVGPDGVLFLMRYARPQVVTSIREVITYRLSEFENENAEDENTRRKIESYCRELRL